jgi:DNA-binding NtrC family response regulator
MKDHANRPPLTTAFALRLPDAPAHGFTAPCFLQNNSSPPAPRSVEPASIYVVDDEECLTELYTVVLKSAGYTVRAFNHREEALAALKADGKKPDLLIMDYRGDSMTADRFIHCLAAYPTVRILMASGYYERDVFLSEARPHRFIQKPFTCEEFQEEVRAALAA